MIDWTKPIETLDGHPVRLENPCGWGNGSNPDDQGDYWVERVDGGKIGGLKVQCVGPDGGDYVRNTQPTTTPDTLDELPELIRQWANDRNLINGATSQAQTVKLFEECGEVAHAVARGDRDKLKDGIGDMVVVLTILAAQNGLMLEECVAAAYDEIKDRTGRMVDGVFIRDT